VTKPMKCGRCGAECPSLFASTLTFDNLCEPCWDAEQAAEQAAAAEVTPWLTPQELDRWRHSGAPAIFCSHRGVREELRALVEERKRAKAKPS